MARIVISINTMNDAFREEIGTETARILRDLASRLEGSNVLPDQDIKLFDINGNRCGYMRV